MGNGALAIGPKLPRPSSTLPLPPGQYACRYVRLPSYTHRPLAETRHCRQMHTTSGPVHVCAAAYRRSHETRGMTRTVDSGENPTSSHHMTGAVQVGR